MLRSVAEGEEVEMSLIINCLCHRWRKDLISYTREKSKITLLRQGNDTGV